MKLAHPGRLSQKALSSRLLLGTPKSSTAWGCQGPVGSPSCGLDAVVQEALGQPGSFGPRSQGQGFPVMDELPRPSSIPHLLLVAGPIAVLRAVRAVVVASFQFFSRQARSHVSGECLEARLPYGADGNAAGAVPGVAVIGGVQAASLHTGPDPVDRASGLPMRPASRLHSFCVQATAALRFPLPQGVGACHDFIPAVAPTAPAGLSKAVAFRPLSHDQAAEALSFQGSGCNHPLSVTQWA